MEDREIRSRIEELKKKWKVRSFEEFEKKIISGEIGLETVGSFEYEDDSLEWEYLEDKLKQKVRVKA